MRHLEEVESVFNRACEVLKLRGFSFRPMNRQSPIKDLKKSFQLANINLKTKTVTIDIFTPRRRQPKKISAILALIAHEVAHYQKKPYRSRWRGRIITRMHYPVYYRQVNRNIKKFKKDRVLGEYYG